MDIRKGSSRPITSSSSPPPPSSEAPNPTGSPPRADGADEAAADGAELDSARGVLESLERDRGTRLLSESDYREMRQAVLVELAHGPRLRTSTLVTFGVVALLLFGLFLLGLAALFESGLGDWLLAAASGGCIAMLVYVARQYISAVRNHSRMSLRERLDELADLRRVNLITLDEYERIHAAILMNRGVPYQ